MPDASQWVVFRCEGRPFGFPLERVSEIITPRPFTRLPGTGPEVCGLIGIRGRVTTVLDLGILLGLRPAAGEEDHRLLMLDLERQRMGVVAEEVVAVVSAQVMEADDGGPAVLGIGRSDEIDFTALAPERLLAPLLPG